MYPDPHPKSISQHGRLQFTLFNIETGFAEAYRLIAGTYAVCLKSLFHTATVGEIEIVAGEITRADLRWPADVVTIKVECVLWFKFEHLSAYVTQSNGWRKGRLRKTSNALGSASSFNQVAK